ncbi:MAG: HAD hydrolase family protein [Syntrophomonadaceae bacterium]|nr:HAD hydrolase family protein [Syntrophomonadaceae bacterium]
MIRVSIPGREDLELHHLVLDMNGTLTTDGLLPDGVTQLIEQLRSKINIYLLTADTFGTGARVARELGIKMFTVSSDHGTIYKANFIATLNPAKTVAIGNGNNDLEMLKQADLAIAVIGQEGCSVAALLHADIVVTNIIDALNLLLHPLRLRATLRR